MAMAEYFNQQDKLNSIIPVDVGPSSSTTIRKIKGSLHQKHTDLIDSEGGHVEVSHIWDISIIMTLSTTIILESLFRILVVASSAEPWVDV